MTASDRRIEVRVRNKQIIIICKYLHLDHTLFLCTGTDNIEHLSIALLVLGVRTDPIKVLSSVNEATTLRALSTYLFADLIICLLRTLIEVESLQ